MRTVWSVPNTPSEISWRIERKLWSARRMWQTNVLVPEPSVRLMICLASSDVRASGFSTSRSEEHTSELQSLMRISYAVFCLQKKTQKAQVPTTYETTNI